MKYLTFIRSSEKQRQAGGPPPALTEAMGKFIERTRKEILGVAKEFMELHRKHWPEFEGESEIRPIEFKLQG